MYTQEAQGITTINRSLFPSSLPSLSKGLDSAVEKTDAASQILDDAPNSTAARLQRQLSPSLNSRVSRGKSDKTSSVADKVLNPIAQKPSTQKTKQIGKSLLAILVKAIGKPIQTNGIQNENNLYLPLTAIRHLGKLLPKASPPPVA